MSGHIKQYYDLSEVRWSLIGAGNTTAILKKSYMNNIGVLCLLCKSQVDTFQITWGFLGFR